VALDREVAAALLAAPEPVRRWSGRLVGVLPNHRYLSESQASDPDPATLRALAALGMRLKNVPRCVAGAEVEPHDHELLDAALLDRGGAIDLDRYVHHYIDHEYYAHSLRCARCAFRDGCRGSHINYLRNFGFRMQRPLDAAGAELADAGSFEDIAEVLKAAAATRGKREQARAVGRHQPDPSARLALAATRLGQPRRPEQATGAPSEP
jgi:hypothetical protein